MENQEIEIVKNQVSKAITIVNEISIVSKETYTEAIDVGGKLKKVSKIITERKEEITKPLNEALKSARALFKPMEEDLENAEDLLKKKMLVWKDEERKLEEEAQKKYKEESKKQRELLAKGEITQEEASKNSIEALKVAQDVEVEKTTKTDTGAKATEKFITEYIVVDKSQIPLIFLEPNMVEIKKAFKDGQPVPGVEERKKAIISF